MKDGRGAYQINVVQKLFHFSLNIVIMTKTIRRLRGRGYWKKKESKNKGTDTVMKYQRD